MFKVGLSDGIGLAGIALAILLVVLDKAGKLKGGWLYGLLFAAGVMTLFIAVGNAWVIDSGEKWRIWRGTLMVCIVGLAYSGIAIWIGPKEQQQNETGTESDSVTGDKTPSLFFVFGAPLGDNASDTWMMMLKHYGPSTAYGCRVDFYDDDRKNIEHQWLAKHLDTPFLPQGMFDQSQTTWKVAEGGPEGSFGAFQWKPLDPNRQHYSVNITCRDGVFTEKWQVTRVNGMLRSSITIEHGVQWVEKNPGKNHVVFKYQDPEFVSTELLTAAPEKHAKPVHPGWKPSHRFEVPVVIIDPNGNMQIMSGVKQPNGSTLTDFGSWNILTRHYGDASP